eukprot:356003-Chlamydomonas_euryale.AAC.2
MRGNAYIAPSVNVHVTPSSELNPSVTMCARRRRLASSAVRSELYCSYDSSPGCGGLSMTDSASWPIVLGDKLIDAHLYTSSIAPGWMLVSSMQPPRRPHSPALPLDTVWNDTISTPSAYGEPMLCMTLRALTNGRSSGPCGAVRRSRGQCGARRRGRGRCGAARRGRGQCGARLARQRAVWGGAAWQRAVWCEAARHRAVWGGAAVGCSRGSQPPARYALLLLVLCTDGIVFYGRAAYCMGEVGWGWALFWGLASQETSRHSRHQNQGQSSGRPARACSRGRHMPNARPRHQIIFPVPPPGQGQGSTASSLACTHVSPTH